MVKDGHFFLNNKQTILFDYFNLHLAFTQKRYSYPNFTKVLPDLRISLITKMYF